MEDIKNLVIVVLMLIIMIGSATINIMGNMLKDQAEVIRGYQSELGEKNK